MQAVIDSGVVPKLIPLLTLSESKIVVGVCVYDVAITLWHWEACVCCPPTCFSDACVAYPGQYCHGDRCADASRPGLRNFGQPL